MEKMKKSVVNKEVNKLESQISNLKLPTVEMPTHQKQLKELLLTSSYFKTEMPNKKIRHKIKEGLIANIKIITIAASIALMLFSLGVYSVFFSTPQVVASIILQINPTITFTLSDRNNVVSAIGLDEDGKKLLSGTNLEGQEFQKALRIIAEILREQNFLTEKNSLYVAVRSESDKLDEAETDALARTLGDFLNAYIKEFDLKAAVVSTPITVQLAEVIQELDLEPELYVSLGAGIGPETIRNIFHLRNELDLDVDLFKSEYRTISSSYIYMTNAGLSAENSLNILRSSLSIDPSLQKISSITAAVIDLHDAGASQEDIMAFFEFFEEQLMKGFVRNLLLEEFSTIFSAKIDLMNAGLSPIEALAVLRAAMLADTTLEELTTITAAMIDLIEQGLSKERALQKIQNVINEDPSLENFDDLLYIPEKEDSKELDDEDEGDKTDSENDSGDDSTSDDGKRKDSSFDDDKSDESSSDDDKREDSSSEDKELDSDSEDDKNIESEPDDDKEIENKPDESKKNMEDHTMDINDDKKDSQNPTDADITDDNDIDKDPKNPSSDSSQNTNDASSED